MNRDSNFDRFERKGWKILNGNDTMDFIKSETEFDLQKWIDSKVCFWSELSPYHECLEDLHYNKDDFNFCA